MINSTTQPIERKTVYAIFFTFPTTEGDVKTSTVWFEDIMLIPPAYFGKPNAKLMAKSFDIFKRPSLSEFKECIKNNNKFWLNTNETIFPVN